MLHGVGYEALLQEIKLEGSSRKEIAGVDSELDSDFVGKPCQTCGGIKYSLVSHHWYDPTGLRHERVICHSCNTQLGKLFKGSYPDWTTQAEALKQRLEVRRKIPHYGRQSGRPPDYIKYLFETAEEGSLR